jgi:hypothetical protein
MESERDEEAEDVAMRHGNISQSNNSFSNFSFYYTLAVVIDLL